MEITKKDLKDIKEYVKSEYPNPNELRLNALTTVTGKILFKEDEMEIYSCIHIHESEKYSSVYMSLSVHAVDWERNYKIDKLGLSVNVLDLEQLKKVEIKSKELIATAKSLGVWK